MVNKKKIRVENNMPAGALGIRTADGKVKILRQPGAFVDVTSEDLWQIYNSCKTIQKGYLFIDDKDMRVELGIEDDEGIDVNALSKQDLKSLLINSSTTELKEILQSDITDATKEKFVNLTREEYKVNSFDAKKLALIEKETGLQVAFDDEEQKEQDKQKTDQKQIKKVKTKSSPSK